MRAMPAAVVAVLIWSLAPLSSRAVPMVIAPHSDGYLYNCSASGCLDVEEGEPMFVDRFFQSFVKFNSASLPAAIGSAVLTVTPWALPFFGSDLEVYGYGTSLGSLTTSEVFAGTFLGKIDVPVYPAPFHFGEDLSIDVTSFVASNTAPYLAFRFNSPTELYTLATLEHNYGHATQLLIVVPEPSAASLVLAGLLAIGLKRRRLDAGA